MYTINAVNHYRGLLPRSHVNSKSLSITAQFHMKNSITDYWKFGPDPAKWTLNVDYDSDDDTAFVSLPDDLIKSAGWELGDTLEWIDNKDGTYSIIKRG